MSKPKFEVGDVVRLKSGGPPMTVAQYIDGTAIKTIWFTGNDGAWGAFNNTNGVFNEAVLEKVKTAKPAKE